MSNEYGAACRRGGWVSGASTELEREINCLLMQFEEGSDRVNGGEWGMACGSEEVKYRSTNCLLMQFEEGSDRVNGGEGGMACGCEEVEYRSPGLRGNMAGGSNSSTNEGGDGLHARTNDPSPSSFNCSPLTTIPTGTFTPHPLQSSIASNFNPSSSPSTLSKESKQKGSVEFTTTRNKRRENQSNRKNLYTLSAIPATATTTTTTATTSTTTATTSTTTATTSTTGNPPTESTSTANTNAPINTLRTLRAKPKSLQLDSTRPNDGATQVIPFISSGSLNFIDVPVLPPSSLLFKPPSKLHPTLHRRKKFNSTETMFIRNHLHTPDVRQIVRCLAKAITLKLRAPPVEAAESSDLDSPLEAEGSAAAGAASAVDLAAFDETYYTTIPMLDRYSPNVSTYHAIHDFLSEVFHHRRLTAECAVVAVAYIDRLLLSTHLHFTEYNWCLISFTALLLAHKVWSEHAVWNEDFVKAFPKAKWLTIDIVRKLEREFLKRINFNLNVKPSVYGRYYFELRSFLSIDEVDFPYFPMNKTIALLLDERSHLKSTEAKRRNRSQSFDSLNIKNGPGRTVVSFDHLMALRKDIVFSTTGN